MLLGLGYRGGAAWNESGWSNKEFDDLLTQADGILDILRPQGVMVVLEAEHLCLAMRGIRKAGVPVVTSAVRGSFRKNAKTRQEFLSFIRMNGAR